jgi:hypothetical protein
VFLYFIPRCNQCSRETIASVGLDAVLDANPLTAKVLANGPDGGPGLLLCDRSYNHVPQMQADRQKWRAAPKRGADRAPFWVGIINDNPPAPTTLARTKQLDGAVVTMHDGSKWTVPRLIEWRDNDGDGLVYDHKLPRILDINDDGQLVPTRIDPAYQAIWDEGWRLHDALTGKAADCGAAVMTVIESHEFACRVLNLNYRVTALEVAMLGLFDDSLPIEVARIAIDDAKFWDALKNQGGRSGEATTDSPSGVERPTQE